jgi:hypothetical protein
MVARIVALATDSPRRNGEGPADGGIAARPSSGVPGVTRRAVSSVAGPSPSEGPREKLRDREQSEPAE